MATTVCVLGLVECIREDCRYYSLVCGCNYAEVVKRERRAEEAAKLVRISDGPVYGKSK